MIPISPKGTTRRIGKSQGYKGLSVADLVTENGTPMMLTKWQPSPSELHRINHGASICLYILGTAHPPVILDVDEIGAQEGEA